jgi:DNA-binding XRE family transcriptional regulator
MGVTPVTLSSPKANTHALFSFPSASSVFSSGNEHFPLHFSEWLKRHRQELDLTQEKLAQRASCSIFAIRKLESGERQYARYLQQITPGQSKSCWITCSLAINTETIG